MTLKFKLRKIIKYFLILLDVETYRIFKMFIFFCFTSGFLFFPDTCLATDLATVAGLSCLATSWSVDMDTAGQADPARDCDHIGVVVTYKLTARY